MYRYCKAEGTGDADITFISTTRLGTKKERPLGLPSGHRHHKFLQPSHQYFNMLICDLQALLIHFLLII